MTLEALRDGDPRQVGPYTLLGRLGEGGMGVVYLGQGFDGAQVAVKLLHARMGANADFRRRFAREVAAAQRVARFCTAPVLDADVRGDVAYLVTEYVEGPSLLDAVRTSGPLKGSALDGLAASMAMALHAIHGAGVVHRDLKPSNVLLSQVGPKVIDFGIAQFADAEVSSLVLGTPAYMSPEQVSDGDIGPASDIFSWGCTVAFAAGGLPPFGSGSVPTVLMRIINNPPDLRGLSGPLHDLVMEALAKNPAERPTARDLMDRLSAGDTSGIPAPRPSAAESSAAESGAAGIGATGSGAAGFGETPTPTPAPTPAPTPSPTAGGEARGAGAGRRKLLVAGAAVLVAVGGASAAVALSGEHATTPTNATSAKAETSSVPPQNPLREEAVTFYAPLEPGASRQAALWATDRPVDAALMRRLAAVPHAIRLNQPEVRAKVDGTVTAATRAGKVPVFVINYLPDSDCVPMGASDMTAYQEWIKGIARQIGQAEAAVILEPSSLVKIPGTKNCDLAGTPDQRYRDIRQAVQTLKANPRTAVYLDGSQDYWPGTEIMAERLIGAGVDKADGFFVNTVGYQATDKAVEYGKALSACVGVRLSTGAKDCRKDADVDPALMPHFVVDTARNGQGAWTPKKHYKDPQTWCNPPGRGAGERPTTETGEELVDAYLWVARAGTSSGRCRRGTTGEKDPERAVMSPKAGLWWPLLALERAKNANPPLR
ncbi:glycoside hydrolase family 6 protein [Nonomuraea insulae]|uniref:Glycoside hydrolase family 6 protein n=1 Tax=Nonomuraea insulae TaxID=1616787 RepID=A0ABW1CLL0_9ACTN